MKKLFKILFKSLSLVLVLSLSIISFGACAKKESKQAANTPTIESVGDVKDQNKTEDVAENVTDDKESTNTDSNNNNASDSTTSELPEDTTETQPAKYVVNDSIAVGFYKSTNSSLTFENIYFENEAELYDFFQTRDLNGVHDIVYKLGFEEFLNSLSYNLIDEEKHNLAFSVSYSENNCNFHIFSEKYENSYDIVLNYFNYDFIDNKINYSENLPKFIYDEASGSQSVIFPFFYEDETTNEITYTPLYVKVDLIKFKSFDIVNDTNKAYTYVENSAYIDTINEKVNPEDALSKLATMIRLSDDEDLLSTILNYELYFSDLNELIISTGSGIILTDTSADGNTYRVYNSFDLKVVNEYYDIENNASVIVVEIDIDENTKFTFKLSNIF